ncbi:type IV pili twitching motility protein PilT [Pokkaliibacter plantistimulans]|uniref:Type IV pili twitching motility protein PilT n=1 Tax=Proteobacteria bacterium 228 TaxID=2083153 RepID=A0A2S5KJ16_9PROT|nr:PilT/PilU family type 4a pilus ATPase [Pokkaliibacter plantistimulans]PPC74625.1 type IV pili twitching motility protein PilT [Pokkaliibacter plantistimulans]
MELVDLLRKMVDDDGSDLYLSPGAPPSVKFNGVLTAMADAVSPDEVKQLLFAVMSQAQIDEFQLQQELNFALSVPGVGRFRVNLFIQRGQIGAVIRNIKTVIPQFDELGLPPVLREVILDKQGLVLFVGSTGSGKSTSLAALIDHRNSNHAGHIISIEDPIEYLHRHKKSIINQREVGMDTHSYGEALKNTLRQAPDLILIGEIRDRDTMEYALAFAETGHLTLSTLHANNANQALDRILNFFPEDRHRQIQHDLSLNIRAFVSQRLLPTVDGKRCAAFEILLRTSSVSELVKRGEIGELKDIMAKSNHIGMMTFDQSIFNLFKEGKITEETAMRNADSPNNMRLMIKFLKDGQGMADRKMPEFNTGGKPPAFEVE